eukprot:Sspe_Gene.99297::Locus_72777_Transcript_1_2_Confidence_0.750_Length_817::g.99297::m.99297
MEQWFTDLCMFLCYLKAVLCPRNVAIAYIIITSVERSLHLGVFAAPPRMSSCSPPMAPGIGVLMVVVFGTGLCDDAALRLAEADRAGEIDVTHMVAQRLADFDLDRGDERLVEANGYPDELLL